MKQIFIFLVVLLPFLAKSQTVIYGKYKYTDSLTFAKYKNNSTLDSVLSVDQNGRLRLARASGLDTTSLSNRIDARVKYTDTSSMLIPYLRKLDTTGKWLAVGYLPYLVKYTDTAAFLSAYYNKTVIDSKLALKLNISDTAAMLSPYARTANLPSLAPYVKYTDTSTMLSPYYRTATATAALALKLNISDTATMLSAYYNKTTVDSKVNLKVNISDTSSMLSPYQRSFSAVKYSDTASMLSAYYNKTATNALLATKLSSVGLSMPSAFTVSNTPLTSNGTIAVTGAGNTSQYIRGDGSLAAYNPGSGGGGSSQVFYFNGGTASSVTGYQQMSTTANTGASADFNISANGYVASFLTDASSPGQLSIPGGNWMFEIYMQSSSAGGSPYFYVELYKYDGSTFTLIASNSGNPEYITNGTAVDLYTTALTVPQTTLTLTDRLAVRVYVVTSGRTITMHTQDSNLSEVITTFSTGITALNGLTAQVQNFATGTSGTDFNISSVTSTHTFNIPTASASNRGLLSSANWTSFNNKVNISDTATMLTPYLRSVSYGLTKSSQTVSADSSLLSTKLWRQKGIDSVSANVNLKVNISDTATMLSPYLRNYNASNTYLPLSGGTLTGALNGTSSNFAITPTFSSSGNNVSVNTLNLSIPASSTFTNGATWTASSNANITTWNGSNTISNGAIMAGFIAVNRHNFGSTGYTETFSQSSGIRASAGFQVLQQTGGSNSGTISHAASMFVQGVYPSGSANVTFTNYYGLLMNSLDEWGGITLTNRWGIYQAGENDNNYFAGNVNIGSNTLAGYKLDVNGNTRINGEVFLGNHSLSAGNILANGTLAASITSNTTPAMVISNAGTFRIAYITNSGDIFGNSFIKRGGASSEFLKADGSSDGSEYVKYLTRATYALMIADGTPSVTTIYSITNDENKSYTRSTYLWKSDGKREWIASTHDN